MDTFKKFFNVMVIATGVLFLLQNGSKKSSIDFVLFQVKDMSLLLILVGCFLLGMLFSGVKLLKDSFKSAGQAPSARSKKDKLTVIHLKK